MLKTVFLSAATAFAIAAPQAQAQDQPPPDQDKFMTTHTPDQWLSTEILGRQVQNLAGEEMGDIDYLLIDESNRVVAAVIGVGGFLGIGRKVVAIRFDEIKRRRTDDGEVELLANVTEEALDAASEFRKSPATRRREEAEEPAGQMTSSETRKRAGKAEAQKEAEQMGAQSGETGSAQEQ